MSQGAKYNVYLQVGSESKHMDFSGPITLRELRTSFNLTPETRLLFAGGKRVSEEDPLPFDASRQCKCRTFGGGAPVRQPEPAAPKAAPAPLPGPGGGGNAQPASNQRCITIVGLARAETRVVLTPGMTYGDVKRQLVAEQLVSDVREYRFLAKGGKSPLDEDIVPVDKAVGLRAVRTEVGHDRREKAVDLATMAGKVAEAEVTMTQIEKRLIDPESAVVERRRLKDQMLDVVQWMENQRDKDGLQARAQQVINRLDS